MKRTFKIEILSAIAAVAMGSLATAQEDLQTNLVQNVNVKLTAYVEGETGVERVRITNRDIAEVLLGDSTTARRGRLQWVSPQIWTEEIVDVEVPRVDENGEPVLDDQGNQIIDIVTQTNQVFVPSYLRIQTGRNEFVVTDGALTRDVVASVEDERNANKTTVYSIDTFVLTAGADVATLQGFTTSKFRNRVRNGVDLGTVGSFKSQVNGTGNAAGGAAVINGSISAASPRVETEVVVQEPPPEEEG